MDMGPDQVLEEKERLVRSGVLDSAATGEIHLLMSVLKYTTVSRRL